VINIDVCVSMYRAIKGCVGRVYLPNWLIPKLYVGEMALFIVNWCGSHTIKIYNLFITATRKLKVSSGIGVLPFMVLTSSVTAYTHPHTLVCERQPL